MIPFNKPYLTGNETKYITQSVQAGHISGNGPFTKKCHNYLEQRYGFKKVLLTTSCTDALEMCALLINIMPGDEVIIPSYTFVSTALAFVRQGAKIIFADSRIDHPGIDERKIETLITPKTKAIVPVHYAGVACNMDIIMELANKYKLFVIEDAAQAIEASYKGKKLGTLGHLSTFSFHETKNIQSGEGGFLAINHEPFIKRAEILWEKGTNRAEFFRGEVNKYGWVDTGSSFLPADIIAAFLFAQLEQIEEIQKRRIDIWNQYYNGFMSLQKKGYVLLPTIPDFAVNNGHMFYLVCKSNTERSALITHLKSNGIYAVFHYLSLHKSEFYKTNYRGGELQNSDRYTNNLVRLPLFYELTNENIKHIVASINKFYN